MKTLTLAFLFRDDRILLAMKKRKFGAGVRSKTQAAQFNEVLLKCLCHNLSMLVHSIHELGVEPKFWLPREV